MAQATRSVDERRSDKVSEVARALKASTQELDPVLEPAGGRALRALHEEVNSSAAAHLD